jgi:two-component system response regulator AtoC
MNAADAATVADEKHSAAFVLPERGVNLEDLERQLVVQALERCGWNQTRAATLLGLNRDQVRYRIEKFGLTAPTPRNTLAFSSTR